MAATNGQFSSQFIVLLKKSFNS